MIRFVRDNSVFFISSVLLAMLLATAPQPSSTSAVQNTNVPNIPVTPVSSEVSQLVQDTPASSASQNVQVVAPMQVVAPATSTTHYSVTRSRGGDEEDD